MGVLIVDDAGRQQIADDEDLRRRRRGFGRASGGTIVRQRPASGAEEQCDSQKRRGTERSDRPKSHDVRVSPGAVTFLHDEHAVRAATGSRRVGENRRASV